MINESKLLNSIQLALDVAGLEPTVGTAADGTNSLISLLRAALAKEKDEKKQHLINAGISALSMIPFADVLKVLKIRKISKPATKAAIKGIRYGKHQAKGYKKYIDKDDIEEKDNYKKYIENSKFDTLYEQYSAYNNNEIEIELDFQDADTPEELLKYFKRAPSQIYDQLQEYFDPEKEEYILWVIVNYDDEKFNDKERLYDIFTKEISQHNPFDDFDNKLFEEGGFAFNTIYTLDTDEYARDIADYEAEARDPYGYRGLSKSDFL